VRIANLKNESLPKNILILNPDPNQAFRLGEVCHESGRVHYSTSINKAIPTLKTLDFNVLVVDSSMADYSQLKGIFKKLTTIVIVGENEENVRNIIRQWPGNRYLDLFTYNRLTQNGSHFKRLIQKAMSHSLLMAQLEKMQFSLDKNHAQMEETAHEVFRLKKYLESATIREIEKRIKIQFEFNTFRKKKNEVENILKKLYQADDITRLLDCILSIKKLVNTSGLTLYIMDKNEMTGAYLKPLIWKDSYISHPEKHKHIVMFDSDDYVIQAVRQKKEIAADSKSLKHPASKRFQAELESSLFNLLALPIIHQDQTIGVLELFHQVPAGQKIQNGFTEEDRILLRKISEHIAIAINTLNLIQYDALTGLLRPEPFFDKVIHKLKVQTKRHKEPDSFALVMGDVDWFKNYNDRNGHEAGNRLLHNLGSILKSSARDEDMVCRYGGEEFLFFLDEIENEKEALLFTDRIRKNVEEFYFENQEYQPRNNLTMSFGITCFPRDRFSPPRQLSREELKKLINEADFALSEAKGKLESASGGQPSKVHNKNTICLYKGGGLENDEGLAAEPYQPNHGPERRKYKRYYTSMPLIFKSTHQGEDQHEVIKTVNISLGGAKIATRKPILAGRSREIIVLIGDKAFECKADVIYSKKGSNSFPFYYAGLKFTEVSIENKKALHKYFMSLS
jgi:diguanylate cyclase (GGDEF)-like protein